ncbi:MAG: OsmC family protein [Gammaproteobacteria bacterium]|nr:OsmC family protein [Gammaproteobacteria bacterium]NVK86535.1 OsmC family protein [Gammaproteobacteria bacterium]
MSEYSAQILWQRAEDEVFIDNQYSRGHCWRFDGGAEVAASASPHIVPIPFAVTANVDPEEAFVAALSSCHMLFFLAIAAKRRLCVEQYLDHAVGIMANNASGNMAMTQVTLRPQVTFAAATQPSFSQLEKMHHQAHEQCFIANSVTTEVVTEIVLPSGNL